MFKNLVVGPKNLRCGYYAHTTSLRRNVPNHDADLSHPTTTSNHHCSRRPGAHQRPFTNLELVSEGDSEEI
jgi:hypothetical protein